jgi:hypothetical protein
MFREVAVVTFTAGMLGTSAATLFNANVGVENPQRPPAIERAPAPPPVESAKPKKPDPDLLALEHSAE